ncbi:CheR family methyltransferase [Silvimonas iriomotensis]|uniref:Chemotaxis protein methyltransferase n=1 Tax=Silvimonas iriomotensis TaxID=449662 RepID=A0ABQ2PB52_9NEIS|nr:CheR family methyltransferase [Silvimonas iriomotensis]GGP22730.1 chemotaxis protein methyltransferase [Silvimonas iriomotensis]
MAGTRTTAPPPVSNEEMRLFQRLFYQQIGMHLPESKRALLSSRLSRRLVALGLPNFRAYHDLIASPSARDERQRAIDLITTNETFFFREIGHFAFLSQKVLPLFNRSETLRIWSAASSTGEEAYSIAMLLDNERPDAPWEIVGSDISQRVLESARRGMYPMVRGENISPADLKKHCLRGTGEYEGQFLVGKHLRERVEFTQMNLTALPARLKPFDVVFLRNVIIYFDAPTKAKVLANVTHFVKPGGYLLVGHSESLHGIQLPLQMISPSVYRKVG